MPTRFITVDEFVAAVGTEEVAQIAGAGSWNGPDGRSLDLPKIEEAIGFAAELLVSHARARYPAIETVSIGDTPGLVKGLVTDVARYRLRARAAGQGQVSEEVRKRYEDAVAFFKKVALGQVELPLAGHPIDGEIAAGVAAIITPGRADRILEGW